MHACPCCRSLTLERPGAFEICPTCGWEDDGQGDADAELVRGGPNKGLSLAAARRNYTEHGCAAGLVLWRLTLTAVLDDDEEQAEPESASGLAFVEAANARAAWEAVELELRADGWRLEERIRARRADEAPIDQDELDFYEEAQREKFVLILDAAN